MNKPLTAAVRGILQKPYAQEWTVQGFGMIRCYLDPARRWRLNIWDKELATGASLIHDHPWNFTSYCIAGCLTNHKFVEADEGEWYAFGLLVPGPDGGMKLPGGVMSLAEPAVAPSYRPGWLYHQTKREIHRTSFIDGTVTLNDRTGRGKDLARVFWPADEKWVDAKPRNATAAEIRRTVDKAMAQLENTQ